MDQSKAERELEVLGDRAAEALDHENRGTRTHRIGLIADQAFDAHIQAALKMEKLCEFHNDNGCCKLVAGHEDKHVVVDFSPRKRES